MGIFVGFLGGNRRHGQTRAVTDEHIPAFQKTNRDILDKKRRMSTAGKNLHFSAPYLSAVPFRLEYAGTATCHIISQTHLVNK
ncbi:MAG: hypothetical protein ACRC46_01105 [Thermoguttaceae bacterium]